MHSRSRDSWKNVSHSAYLIICGLDFWPLSSTSNQFISVSSCTEVVIWWNSHKQFLRYHVQQPVFLPYLVSWWPWPLIFWPQNLTSPALSQSCNYGEIPANFLIWSHTDGHIHTHADMDSLKTECLWWLIADESINTRTTHTAYYIYVTTRIIKEKEKSRNVTMLSYAHVHSQNTV